MRRLPPLNALRAFETAARHGTLTRAAEELLVTPTAVGRHVKNLEDSLGTQLFERDGGTLTLTREGRQYARALGRAFEMMGEATDLLLDTSSRSPITLRAYTTLLVRWLIPKLPDFQRQHPEVDLRLTTAFDAVDFNRDNVELGVRYGHGNWPGLHSTLLFRDELVAFCGNGLRDVFDNETLAEAFASVTLLTHTLHLDDWPDWFEAAGLSDVIPARRMPLNDMALIFQGALDGLGAGLSQRCYLDQDLAAGRLHLVSPVVLRRDRGFHLVCRPETMNLPAVQAFITWIESLPKPHDSEP
jgi:LysR family glycine cleavage system transcriptional activator